MTTSRKKGRAIAISVRTPFMSIELSLSIFFVRNLFGRKVDHLAISPNRNPGSPALVVGDGALGSLPNRGIDVLVFSELVRSINRLLHRNTP